MHAPTRADSALNQPRNLIAGGLELGDYFKPGGICATGMSLAYSRGIEGSDESEVTEREISRPLRRSLRAVGKASSRKEIFGIGCSGRLSQATATRRYWSTCRVMLAAFTLAALGMAATEISTSCDHELDGGSAADFAFDHSEHPRF